MPKKPAPKTKPIGSDMFVAITPSLSVELIDGPNGTYDVKIRHTQSLKASGGTSSRTRVMEIALDTFNAIASCGKRLEFHPPQLVVGEMVKK